MTEKCLICDKDGDFYLTCGPFKTGPYCSQHRWELGNYIVEQRRQMTESKFNEWVDVFQKREEVKR